uniref:Death domain-containing protein n=2 Tax=Amphimedon queenslandica TaxID=400682 RepID=A0A1X7U763_AMPQE
MIDVSQWRASIGLWNYCQAASSRPANGCHSHSFKAAVDSKSGSTTSEEKTSKLPATLSFIAFLLLLFLSLLRHILMIPPTGDVELNPGPMIDDRPDISLLTQWLEPLVDWKRFGLCLVGIKEHEISKIEQEHIKIEDRKLALCSKWLSVDPKATWRDVINALTTIKENKLAQDIKDNEAFSTDSLLSPRTSSSNGNTEIIFFPKDDQAVRDSLDQLQAKFSHIMIEIKSIFRKKVTDDGELSTKISDWVEHQLNLKHVTVDNNLDDIFAKIHVYLNYDFIDCSLIVAMCNEFISDEKDLLDELKIYSLRANTFRSARPITDLKKKLRKVYGPYRQNLESMPLICIELQNPWNDVTINGLYILVRRLLPKEFRQSIMKCITIEEGSVVIKLHILDITADSLIEYTGGKLQLMRLIGIFSLYINDHLVLQEDENMNFTFELALLEAVTAGNNEAVEFLLQLGYIDYTNEGGRTALMLACERGREDIVHSLLSAGANVDFQDNNGVTALMLASKHKHISIIHMLLQANANPHVKTLYGSNAVMIASYYGNCEVLELLISKGVDYKYQREDGWNALAVACQNGHIQIVELLLKKKVDPNVQINNEEGDALMLACLNAHTKIVELLVKEQVDPNVQIWKNGTNSFMLACQNGHIQIVELLLKKKVDPNIQRNDGANAFMLACKNGHTKIVELLLKKLKVDPNVQDKNGMTALMLARHFKIVKLLLEWKADPTIESNEGHTALYYAKTNATKTLLNNYLEKKKKDTAKYGSQLTLSSGYHTVSDISSTRSYPSTLTLDSATEDSEVDTKT